MVLKSKGFNFALELLFMRHFLLLLVAFTFLLSSCSLSKKKCPIPSCKISKMHQHALIFTNEGKAKKVKKKLKKELADSTSIGDEGVLSTAVVGDSSQVAASSSKKKKKKEKRKKKKNKKSQEDDLDSDLILTEQEKQLLAESGETIETPKAQPEKKQKKSKKNKDENFDGESGLTSEEQADENEDEDLKLSAKEIRKANKEARNEEKRIKKEEKEKDPFNAAYRSRITPWWGKDQHPEVGEDWKRTKKVYDQPDERKARKLFRNLFGYPTR